ncbi:hypothetical protein Desti_5541 [Desulfomonile tiedjei DSM 6799]|uniref:Uncharacterized protein n=1 Tax=Desulfomonile tiedjei (strain ATCC 49306 / DSM 6799 / DCB-1) TaxID=706587 RepID=I4CEY2_DESTA|nr:hypothetical protein Desti_5541 [Desulfomonile tiedjei DSM 6799]
MCGKIEEYFAEIAPEDLFDSHFMHMEATHLFFFTIAGKYILSRNVLCSDQVRIFGLGLFHKGVACHAARAVPFIAAVPFVDFLLQALAVQVEKFLNFTLGD